MAASKISVEGKRIRPYISLTVCKVKKVETSTFVMNVISHWLVVFVSKRRGKESLIDHLVSKAHQATTNAAESPRPWVRTHKQPHRCSKSPHCSMSRRVRVSNRNAYLWIVSSTCTGHVGSKIHIVPAQSQWRVASTPMVQLYATDIRVYMR